MVQVVHTFIEVGASSSCTSYFKGKTFEVLVSACILKAERKNKNVMYLKLFVA